VGLTKEQKEIRKTGIGASEAAAILELSPHEQPIDIWLEKMGRSEEQPDTAASELGTAIEAGLVELYSKRSGIQVTRPCATFRHPERTVILASPDGLSVDGDGGCEIKVVGFRMQHHWEDGMPDYVEIQARQNMAVFGRSWWDVGRLIGTDFEIYRIERDLKLEEEMLEALTEWWANHVIAEVPPPALDPVARRRWILERYPRTAEGKDCRKVADERISVARSRFEALVSALEAVPIPRATTAEELDNGYVGFDVGEAMRWLSWWDGVKATGETASQVIETELCELVGADYGIEHEAGRFVWYPCAGQPSWKAIANELAGGSVPEQLIAKHRGNATRKPKLTMAKPKLGKRARKV